MSWWVLVSVLIGVAFVAASVEWWGWWAPLTLAVLSLLPIKFIHACGRDRVARGRRTLPLRDASCVRGGWVSVGASELRLARLEFNRECLVHYGKGFGRLYARECWLDRRSVESIRIAIANGHAQIRFVAADGTYHSVVFQPQFIWRRRANVRFDRLVKTKRVVDLLESRGWPKAMISTPYEDQAFERQFMSKRWRAIADFLRL
jgi:hypothetical protein